MPGKLGEIGSAVLVPLHHIRVHQQDTGTNGAEAQVLGQPIADVLALGPIHANTDPVSPLPE